MEKVNQDSWEQYIEIFSRFNKLKKKYDDKITNAKNNFNKKNPNASIQEKKEALQKFKSKMRCLNCNKPGGNIFTMYTVKCGNTQNPCDLDIQLKKPTVHNLSEKLSELKKEINLVKRNITQDKLDLLFELDDEEVVLLEFQNKKDNLEKLLSAASEIKDYYDNLNLRVVMMGENEEKTFISKQEHLNNKHKELNQLVSDFKKNITLFSESGEISVLNDALAIYKNVIIPLQFEIRRHKYQVIYMDKISKSNNGKINKKEMPIFHFKPVRLSIEKNVVPDTDFEILSNKK